MRARLSRYYSMLIENYGEEGGGNARFHELNKIVGLIRILDKYLPAGEG
jgi:hypothetical protein